MKGEPWSVFRMAYISDEDIGRQACISCLNSSSTHPLILELRRQPLYDEAMQWIAGESLFEIVDYEFRIAPQFQSLASFIAELRFASSSDRRQEGEHARSRKWGRSAPETTHHFMSFNSRIKEIQNVIAQAPPKLNTFAYCFSLMTNARRCAIAMGLEDHPHLMRQAEQGRL